jgi:hypothetical protein
MLMADEYLNTADVWTVLDLIVAEWQSDPTSVACFDGRLIDRAIELNRTRPPHTTLDPVTAAAPDLLEAVRAGGRYSDALRRYQEHGVRGGMIPGTDELERLFLDWHDKGHAAVAKAEGRG